MNNKKLQLLAAAAAFSLLATQGAFAQKKYDTGASDTEIKIGNVEAYSGPASAYGIIGKTEEAYFKMINDQGGINGRKINWISYDDGYSPPKTVEQIRKLIESDEVFLVFNALGTPTQTAVQKYHNAKKVPQLFLATGASKWNDPKDFPWTMGFQPSYRVEARIFAKYILKEKPDAKVAIFYANDDFGKGLRRRHQGDLRCQGRKPDRGGGKLRNHRALHRRPHRQAEGHRRRCARQHLNAEICRPSHQEDGRARMEADARHDRRVDLDRRGDEAGRLRGVPGHPVGGLSEGRLRPAVEGRRGHEEVHGLRRQVHARRQHLRRQPGLRFRGGADHGRRS